MGKAFTRKRSKEVPNGTSFFIQVVHSYPQGERVRMDVGEAVNQVSFASYTIQPELPAIVVSNEGSLLPLNLIPMLCSPTSMCSWLPEITVEYSRLTSTGTSKLVAAAS